jgi:hypothetical protein
MRLLFLAGEGSQQLTDAKMQTLSAVSTAH